MPEAITSLMPLFQGISAGGGLVGNIIGGIQRGQEVDALRQQQKIASDPAEVSKRVAAATQPLDNSLVQAVTNATQGAAAERGLATSPGIFSAMESQALAPYVQNEQSMALQQVLNQLKIPVEYGNAILGLGGGGANLTSALQALMMRNAQTPPASGTNYNIPGYGGGGIGDYGGYPDMGGFGGGADIPFSGYGTSF